MHGIASNKGFKRALIALFLVAMMAVGPLGAVQHGSAYVPEKASRGEVYLRVAMQDNVKTLNPLSAGDVWTWNVIGWMFDGLVWRNITNNDHIEPWAAEWFHHGPQNTWNTTVGYPDYDNNNDFRNWTVKLRPNIKWHDWKSQTGDNRFVRAHDVIFSLRLMADVPRYMSSLDCIVARNPNGSIMYGRDLQKYDGGAKVPLINYENGKVSNLSGNPTVDLSSQAKYPNLPVVYVWEDSDDLTLHYFTTYQYVDFTIDTLSSLIMPERIWKNHIADKLTWSDPQCLISFGPFTFVSSDLQQAKIDTFRDYFHTEYDKEGNPKPYIDGIIFVIYRNTDTAISALESGKVDYIAWTIDPSYIDEIKSNPQLTLVRNSDLGFFYVAFNMRIPDFGYAGYKPEGGSNPTYTGNYTDVGKPFRVAVAHLVDKQTIVQTYLQGFGTVGTSVVSPANNFWYNPNIKIYQYDPQEAKRILDKYANDTDGDGIYNLPTLGEQQITLLTPPADYDPIRQQAGQLIQSTAQSIGLNIKSVPTQFGTIVDKINSHDFQMYMLGWSIPTPLSSATAPCDFFSSRNDMPGGNNYPGYHNKTFDQLCEKMQREPDINKRRAIAFQLQDAIAEDVPYIVLYYRDVVEAYNNEFQGWVPRYGTIFNWYSLENIRKEVKSNYELTVTPSTTQVISGNNVTFTATLTDKSNGQPIPGVNVTFSVSGGNISYTKTVPTNSQGVAVLQYTAPTVNNQTLLKVKASVYDKNADATIESAVDIAVLPPTSSEYNIEIRVLGGTSFTAKSGDPVSVKLQVLLSSTGEVLGPYNSSSKTGVTFNISVSPSEGADFEQSSYSNGYFEYTFTGNAPAGETKTYTVTITASYHINGMVSPASQQLRFVVTGPSAGGGGGQQGGGSGGNNSPSIGIIPILASVGMAAIIYNSYRRKKKS